LWLDYVADSGDGFGATTTIAALAAGDRLDLPDPAGEGPAHEDRQSPPPRRLVGWIMTRPTDLTEQDRGHLDDLLVSCPSLAILVEHVRRFADLLTNRRGADLEDWMTAVEASYLPALHAFVRGLRKDLDAVLAGLSLPYSNGPIEGTNTKFKLLKRQMYGRAGFALLRQRLLLS